MKSLVTKVARSLENIGSSSHFARPAALALALVAGVANATPTYRATLTVSGYDEGASPLANFPVLVRISAEKISGFSYGDCAANGADLSFVDVSGNSLAHEIDTWDTSGESLVWVKIPSLANGTTFTMQWNDSAVTDSTSTNATWNSNYVGVWHLGEESGVCANSTSAGATYAATPAGAGAANSVRYTGKDAPVGYARTTATSAAKSYLSIPTYDAASVGGTFTMSGWVRLDQANGYARIFSRKTNYTGTGWEMETQSGSVTAFDARGETATDIKGTMPTLLQSWVHLALVYDDTTLTVYGNGEQVQTGTISAAKDNNLPLSFGCNSDGSESYVIGQFDECRLMKGVASADWVKAEYDTVTNADFLTYGAAGALDPKKLNASAPFVSAVGDNYAKVSVKVASLGEGASSATVTVAYGPSENALTETASTTVGSASSAEVTLTRLLPDHAYAARVTVKNDQGAEAAGDVLTFATAASSDTGGLPGLNQTFFTSANANWTKDYSALPEGTDWTNCTDANRVYRRELGAIAAYATVSVKYTSEIWKDQVYWKNGGQWCYWGRMWMEAGKSYRFRSKIDDNEYVKVTNPLTDEEMVLIDDRSNGSSVITSGAYVPAATGWHPVEIRMSDGSGGAGGYDSSNGNKNTNNLGYSSDDGQTWNLVIDPGDGSLLRTDSGFAISVAESVASGKLTLALSFDAGTSARTLAVVWGPAHGGETTNGWAHAEILGTVAAADTSYSYPLPDSWGTDDNLVVRFCFVSDDAAPAWSPSTYWRDLAAPVLGDLALDGTGGDTLVVKGEVASFGGDRCALKVLTGASADALTQTWTGLEGATLSSSGAFSLTLFEGDANASRYLKPGSSVYVCVEATDADGRTARSAAKRVKMSSAAEFASSPSVAVSRRTVTVTGALADLGCGDAPALTLWVGEKNDEASLAKSEASVALSGRSYSVTHTFAAFEKDYWCQIRATNTAAGGTASFEAKTALVGCHTKDTTTYAWKGGDNDKWESNDNWMDDRNGDCLGYPQSANARVVIPKGTSAKIALRAAHTIGGLDLSAANASLTLVQGGTDTNATKLTVNNVNGGLALTGANASLTLDNVALATSAVDLRPGATFALTVRNGSDLYCSASIYNNQGGTVTVSGGSTASVNNYWSGPGTLTLDDSTFCLRNLMAFYSTGKSVVNFLGAKPLLAFVAAGGFLSPNNDGKGCDAHFVFSVPEGGYATPPVQGHASASYLMGNWQNSTYAGTLTVDVAADSPAKLVDATTSTTLFSWPAKGVRKAFVAEGQLQSVSFVSGESFDWGEGDAPATLGVTVVGTTGANRLTVVSSADGIAGDGFSPAAGTATAVERDGTVTCTAPGGTFELSDTKRATCTGWRLYEVDVATLRRTLVGSGAGTSYSYVNSDGLWHELEWQWKVEYKVTASVSDGGGTAQVNGADGEAWVVDGERAKVSVAADATHGFGKWSGDGLPSEHAGDHVLDFVVRRAYDFAATTLPALYVKPDGDDANSGADWDSALATVDAALAKATSDAGVYVYVADGVYERTNRVLVATGSTVAGASPGAKAVFKMMLSPNNATVETDQGETDSVFTLKHADARLYNAAVTTDYDKDDSTKNAYGAQRSQARAFTRGVWMEGGGLVDSCVVTNCRARYCGSGGGVRMKNGGVVRSTFMKDNSCYASGGNWGGGYHVYTEGAGALVETCTMLGGGAGYNASSSDSVYVSAGCTVRNSLVACGTAGHTGAHNSTGAYLNGGTLENCTVVKGSHSYSTDVPGVYVNNSASVVRNCVIWDNRHYTGLNNLGCGLYTVGSRLPSVVTYTCTSPDVGGTGDVDVNPAFVDADAGDFRIRCSRGVDGAVAADWMDWTTDLAGNTRIQGDAPDMGCYELASAALACGFEVATTGALDRDDVTLTAVVKGDDLRGLAYAWTLTDALGAVTTQEATDATVSLSLPAGIYDVALTVRNGAGAEASASRAKEFQIAPKDIYVSPTGEPAYPYASYETGAADLQTAVDAAGGGTVIHLAAGWHRVPDGLPVGKDVTIVGDEGPEKTFVHGRVTTTSRAMVTLASAGATLSGLTLSGRDEGETASPRQYCAICMTAGVVTNCVVANNTTVNNSFHGAGCRMTGGTVVDCVFSNNLAQSSGGWGTQGGAINMSGSGSLVDRCVIVDNAASEGGGCMGGGVYVGGGVLRNSFVARNFSQTYGGGVAIASGNGGKVQNCTIVGNETKTSGGAIYVSGAGTKYALLDNLAYNNTVGGSVEDTTDPGFADAANGDYHLAPGASAIDAATGEDLGDYDLELNPRVSGAAADQGCYEYDQTQVSVGISYEKAKAFGAGAVTFTATATNAKLDGETCYWTFDGREPTAADHDATGTSVTRDFTSYGYVTVRFATTINGAPYAADKPKWFTVYGDAIHVVAANESAAYPYATWETAATNLTDAFSAVQEGSTIILDDGTYAADVNREIKQPLTIRSRNGAEKTILKTSVPNLQPFCLMNDEAVVSGLTFTNVSYHAGGNAAAIRISGGGRVEDCVFVDCVGHWLCSGAVRVDTRGEVVGCRFLRCRADGLAGSGSFGGAAVSAYGADTLIDRCIVEDCGDIRASANAVLCKGAVYVQDGTVRNTVVANCRLVDTAGVVADGAAKVENCTIVGNTSTNDAAATVGGLRLDSANVTVVNTVVYGNKYKDEASEAGGVEGYADRLSSSLVGTDPQLRGSGAKAYAPKATSPCVNAGARLDWMTDGALDVYGKARVNGSRPDIGAAEAVSGGGFILIVR